MMSQKSKPLSKRTRWRLEYAIYRVFECFLGFFSLRTVFLIGEVIGSIFYRVSPVYRIIVRRNLRIVMDKKAWHEPTEVEVEKVFRRNIANMLTTIVAYKIRDNELYKYLQVEGNEVLNECLRDTGAVLMLSHMGNWEVLTKFTELLPEGTLSNALYRPLNNPHMNALIVRRRQKAGMTLVSKENPAFTLIKTLKKKGVVSILSDQKIGGRGSLASFFGVLTPCSRLPHLLHEKAKVPLFVVTMETVAPARWKLIMKKLDSPTNQQAFDALALGMHKSFEDCFWFQDRWQETPRHMIQHIGKPCSSEHFAEKKLTCILESRTLDKKCPGVVKMLRKHYNIIYWDEGASPVEAYFALSENHDGFRADCYKCGIKKRFFLTPGQVRGMIRKRKLLINQLSSGSPPQTPQKADAGGSA